MVRKKIESVLKDLDERLKRIEARLEPAQNKPDDKKEKTAQELMREYFLGDKEK